MAIDGKKLVNYLAHGIAPSQIAAALNITPARVTQLAAEDRVIQAVEERKKTLIDEGMTEIANLKQIKSSLIDRMEDLVLGTDSLSEAVNALEKIDKMTSTKLGKESDDGGVKQIILQAPIFIQNQLPSEVVLDSQRRIISIKDRSMAQMPTAGVLKILQEGQKHGNQATDSEQDYATPEDYAEPEEELRI